MKSTPVEAPPPGEEEAIQAIKTMLQQRVKRAYDAGDRPARRDAHPKSHGCVHAEFTVHADLPTALRRGVFSEPATYAAWVRFSSGASPMRSDHLPNFRGVAIKLMGVPGEKLLADESATQDFLLLNHPQMFIRNAIDYAEFFRCVGAGGEVNALPFFFRPWPPRVRWHELVNIVVPILKRVSSVLRVQYWSQTPFSCGEDTAVKFTLVPSSELPTSPSRTGSDFLRENLIKHLIDHDARFEFQAQMWLPGHPIEDPTLPWYESPFHTLATLRIPRQQFDTTAMREFDENLSYTPWHAVSEHRPLGGINRVRRAVYESISELRHRLNQAPRREPTPDGGTASA